MRISTSTALTAAAFFGGYLQGLVPQDNPHPGWLTLVVLIAMMTLGFAHNEGIDERKLR